MKFNKLEKWENTATLRCCLHCSVTPVSVKTHSEICAVPAVTWPETCSQLTGRKWKEVCVFLPVTSKIFDRSVLLLQCLQMGHGCVSCNYPWRQNYRVFCSACQPAGRESQSRGVEVFVLLRNCVGVLWVGALNKNLLCSGALVPHCYAIRCKQGLPDVQLHLQISLICPVLCQWVTEAAAPKSPVISCTYRNTYRWHKVLWVGFHQIFINRSLLFVVRLKWGIRFHWEDRVCFLLISDVLVCSRNFRSYISHNAPLLAKHTCVLKSIPRVWIFLPPDTRRHYISVFTGWAPVLKPLCEHFCHNWSCLPMGGGGIHFCHDTCFMCFHRDHTLCLAVWLAVWLCRWCSLQAVRQHIETKLA